MFNKMFTARLCFLLLVAGLASCYFEPDGEFYKTIEKRNTNAISIKLEEGKDTVYVSSQTLFSYSVSSLDFPFVSSEVLVNDQVIYTGRSKDDYFVIDPNYFSPGFYTVTIKAIVQNGNGSLADNLGLDNEEILFKKIFVIDGSAPEKPSFIKMDTATGTVLLNWSSYTKWNFGYYKIIKYCTNDNYYFYPCKTILIDSAQETVWDDVDFVGGWARYSLTVVGDNNKESTPVTQELRWEPTFDFQIVNNELKVHWSSPKFLNNTVDVVVSHKGRITGKALLDTTYTSSELPSFGTLYNDLSISFRPADQLRSFTFSIPYFLGDGFSAWREQPVYFNPLHKLYHSLGFYDGVKYSILDEEFQVLATTRSETYVQQALSENGAHLITLQYENSKPVIYQTDAKSLELSNRLPIVGSFEDFSVSNTGLIAIQTRLSNCVISLPAYDTLYRRQTFSESLAISSTGKYLVDNGKIFELKNGQYEHVSYVNFYPVAKAVFLGNDKLLVADRNRRCEVYDLNTFAQVYSFQTNIPSYSAIGFQYDSSSDAVLIGNNSDGYYLLDVASLVVKRLPHAGYRLTLCNGKVFTELNGWNGTIVYADLKYFK